MSTLSLAVSSVNPLPAAWAALSYVADKEGDRDALEQGAAYRVDLIVTGSIDGQPVRQEIAGRLSIGHNSARASSATPNLPSVVGWILSKLNAATREAICRDLPAEFAEAGCAIPSLPVGYAQEAEALLAKLRQTKQVTARGAVKCEYALVGTPDLAIAG